MQLNRSESLRGAEYSRGGGSTWDMGGSLIEQAKEWYVIAHVNMWGDFAEGSSAINEKVLEKLLSKIAKNHQKRVQFFFAYSGLFFY